MATEAAEAADTATVDFVTIATRTHLAPALAVMRSIGADRRWRRRIVLVDCALPGGAVEREGILIEGLSEAACARLRDEIGPDYTVPEICFALKPLLIGEALADGAKACAYVDSDLLFFSVPSALLVDALEHPICLTPHYLQQRTFDAVPGPLTLLRAGVFNAGFVTVSACDEGRAFVDWWWMCARRHGYNLPKRGMCGDQRWLDLVPVLFPGAHVIRRSGVQVGYWNAAERGLRGGEEGPIRTSDGALEFFHFSGFNVGNPLQLSRFQQGRVERSSPMGRLLTDYSRALQSATPIARSLEPVLVENASSRLIRQRRWWRLARRLAGRPVS